MQNLRAQFQANEHWVCQILNLCHIGEKERHFVSVSVPTMEGGHCAWTGCCTSLYPSLQLEGFQFVATVMNNATKTIAKIAGRTLILRYPNIFLYQG